MFCGGEDLRCGMYEHAYHMWLGVCSVCTLANNLHGASLAFEIACCPGKTAGLFCEIEREGLREVQSVASKQVLLGSTVQGPVHVGRSRRRC